MPNVARLIDMFCMHCRFRKSLESFRREPMAGRLIALIFAISLLSVSPLTPAGAIPITVSFTAASFIELEEAVAAPMDPVTGSIVYDAASTTSNINSLTSINLTITGHTYLLSEVGFISPFGSNGLRQWHFAEVGFKSICRRC